MDAEGLLRKQGWKGAGHSLDNHGRGIKKPLLISHKQDTLGIGKKKAAHTVDDQWWMRAFDESLQNLGTGQTSTLSQIQEKGINRGGLYGFFVKGEGLVGTITSESESEVPAEGESTPPTSASEGESSSDSSDDDSDSDPESANESDESSESSDSDSDTASDTSKMAKLKTNQNKRKRGAEEEAPAQKKLKQENGAVNVSVPAGPATEVKTALGTLGPEQWTKMRAVVHNIGKQVTVQTKANEKNGVYGVYISAKQTKGRAKGEAQKQFDDPNNPSKKLTFKTARIQRQKGLRDAKKVMTKELVVQALLKGNLPNPNQWSREEILENYSKVEKAIKAVEEVQAAAKKAKLATGKQKVRDVRVEQRRIEAEQRAAAKQAKLDAKQAKLDQKRQDIAAEMAGLSPGKKADYEARAAEKGQTLEQYVLRRKEKKDAKRAEKEGDTKKATPLFFVDTEGDTTMSILTAPPVWTPLEDGTCPLDPSLWENGKVKDLPKPVREARRQYLENQRNERKLAAGKSLEKRWTHKEKKMEQIKRRTGAELTRTGIKKGATTEQMNVARGNVKRAMKGEKRAKKEGKGEKARAGRKVTSSVKLADKVKGRQKVSSRAKVRNGEKAAVAAAASD